MRARITSLVLLALALALATPAQASSQAAIRYTFPATEQVFPEGIAAAGGGVFFVGSTTTGAVYRGSTRSRSRALQVFLPGGSDGRTDVRGMKVDGRGFLWLAGGATGTMWLYDARSGKLLSSFADGAANSFVNDVAIGPDGAAYFTDSNVPILYRIAPDAGGIFRLEYWRDLRDSPIQYTQGFNLNGIVVTPDGKYVIVVQSNTGKLFRIATDTREISEIMLAGGDRVTNGDGLLLDGQTLHVVRNSLNLIVQLRLAPDYASGQQVGSFSDPSFALTTTIARSDKRLLVVNSQFNRRAGSQPPDLPFWVSSVALP
jgi:Cu-Zn family superoxide dismutase